MANFSASRLPSAEPNALFDLAANDRAVQQTRVNDLLLLGREQQAEDGQTLRDLAPALAAGDRGATAQAAVIDPQRTLGVVRGLATADEAQRRTLKQRQAVLGDISHSIMQLPEQQRDAAYQVGVQALRGAGYDMTGIPGTYPGHDKLEVFRDMLRPSAARQAAQPASTGAASSGAASLAPDISASRYAGLVGQVADRYGVPRSLALALVGGESGGVQQDAATGRTLTSSAGALGLTQLMPGTAKSLGVDPHDPAQNVDGGMRFLSQMLHRYGGDADRALAAYNWGPGNVDGWIARGANPAALPAETQAYLRRVRGRASLLDDPAQA